VYKIGTKGAGQLQFSQEVYLVLQLPLKILGVDNWDLELFVKDIPFNFIIKQAMESLGDLGILAKVVQFHTLIAHILVYAKLA